MRPFSSKIKVMNDDDESFLSAFLDGELNAGHEVIESALVANPHLAEKLRALSLVRDLVAGLPHDGSIDVTARVMQQIHARSRRGLLPTLDGWRRGSRRILPLAGLAASAASLMVAASLAILMQTTRLERAGVSLARDGRTSGVITSNPTATRAPSKAPRSRPPGQRLRRYRTRRIRSSLQASPWPIRLAFL